MSLYDETPIAFSIQREFNYREPSVVITPDAASRVESPVLQGALSLLAHAKEGKLEWCIGGKEGRKETREAGMA